MKLSELSFFLLLLGSGGVALSSDLFFINPAYVITVLGLGLSGVFLVTNNYMAINKCTFLGLILFSYFFVMFVIYRDQSSIPVLLSYTAYILSYSLIKNISKIKVLKMVNMIINIFILMGILDFVYRNQDVNFLDIVTRRIENFYLFKTNSLLYADTNYVGNFFVILFSFILTLKENGIRKTYFKYNTKLALVALIIILTLSRAAMIALVVIYFLNIKDKISDKRFKIMLQAFSLIIMLFISIRIYNIVKMYPSYSLKLSIFKRVFDYLKTVDIFKFFLGTGFSTSGEQVGVYAHNIFLVYIVEKGVVGFVLFLSFIIFLYIKNKKSRLIIMAFLIPQLSASSYYYSFAFLSIIITEYLFRSRQKIRR